MQRSGALVCDSPSLSTTLGGRGRCRRRATGTAAGSLPGTHGLKSARFTVRSARGHRPARLRTRRWCPDVPICGTGLPATCPAFCCVPACRGCARRRGRPPPVSAIAPAGRDAACVGPRAGPSARRPACEPPAAGGGAAATTRRQPRLVVDAQQDVDR